MQMPESTDTVDPLTSVEDLLASDDEWLDTNPFNVSPLNRPDSAERLALALPSAIGIKKCIELGYKPFAKTEKTLRIGQLNDALQNIRLGLSQKAVVFREGLRRVKSKVRKTRLWQQIAQVDNSVRHHAQVYTRARAAIVRLGATEEELNRYKILQSSDLNVSTARIDPSARGNRDKGLAWFWTMDVSGDSDAKGRMGECEYFQVQTLCVCVRLMLNYDRSLPRPLVEGKGSHEPMVRRESHDSQRDDMGASAFHQPSDSMAVKIAERA